MGEAGASFVDPTVHCTIGPDGLARCPWVGTTRSGGAEDYRAYHDGEWGVPVHGERALLERLCLEAFQSGLSWLTILRKREAFRREFAQFEPDVVAAYTEDDVERLMTVAAIVRNRRKIEATITNARATVALRASGGLDQFFWSAAAGQQDRPRPVSLADVPSRTPVSVATAKRLKELGFAHLGPTTVYAAMQACGLVDDHLAGCFRAETVIRP